ncbi:MAG: PAS domain S-box protein [Nitrospirae bacterium]|nr:PAS domain S-box protein [Nitrospirota bacterium]
MFLKAITSSEPFTDSPPGRRPYVWLPVLIIVMTVVAVAIGVLALHYIETRLVATTGESLALAAAEIADKLDRLLFERYGDAKMMARAFSIQAHDKADLTEYLTWMKKSYAVYLWLGVTDKHGRVVAATDQATVGQDLGRRLFFQYVQEGGLVHVGDVEPYVAAGGVDAVAFSARITNRQGEFLGVVTSSVALPALEEVLTRTIRTVQAQRGILGKLEYQFLTRQGVAFIDSDLQHKGNVNLKQLGLPSALLIESGQPGYVEEEHLRRHVPVVTGYAKTQGYREYAGLQWGILLRMDRSDILAPIRAVLWNLGVAGAVIWGPMFGLLLWATVRLRKEYVQAQQEREHARTAEAALRESEERTRLIVETALDAVITIDEGGWITDWNPQAETIFGWSRQEAIGQRLSDTIIPPQYRDAHESGLRHYLATGEGPVLNRRIEITARRRDGHEFPVELSISPARRGNIYTFSAFVRDITERKRAESRQAAQLAVSRALADSATLGEAAPRLLRAICETMGWELGAIWLVDRPANVLRCNAIWHAPSVNVAEFVLLCRQITFVPGIGLPGRVWNNGEPAWIPDVVKDSNFPRAPAAAKVRLHGAFGFPIRGGNEIHGVVEFFSHEVREPDNELLHMMADVGIKIGQFVERLQLEGQFRQAQKMEAIGQMAGGVAHDFNNLLTIVTGYCQLLLTRFGPNDLMRGQVEEIKRAADRATTLTGQLLAFSRRQILQPEVLDLNVIVANMDKMLRPLIGADIELVTEPGPTPGHVRADPGQLEQVVMNLAVNARDAMPQGGRLTTRTQNVMLDRPYASRQVTIPPGSYVTLMVSDTGCGMDAETQARVFEPFFTTKERGKGTGLGLSTVYGIIKQSGGYIIVDSKTGQGTTFTIYLPRIEEAMKAVEPSQPLVGSPRGSETILLAEDEDSIRTMLCVVLRARGYTVLEARDGHDALRIGREHTSPIHLLLTDIVMPGLGGRQLAERLAPIRPKMKVLYISGYTGDVVGKDGALEAGTVFLQKPFTPESLERHVREALERPR